MGVNNIHHRAQAFQSLAEIDEIEARVVQHARFIDLRMLYFGWTWDSVALISNPEDHTTLPNLPVGLNQQAEADAKSKLTDKNSPIADNSEEQLASAVLAQGEAIEAQMSVLTETSNAALLLLANALTSFGEHAVSFVSYHTSMGRSNVAQYLQHVKEVLTRQLDLDLYQPFDATVKSNGIVTAVNSIAAKDLEEVRKWLSCI